MIVLIIAALVMLATMFVKFRRWSAWVIPILALLLHGLVYSIVYINEAAHGGIQTPLLYNYWNSFLRAQTYLTVIAYIAAFQIMQGRVSKDG